MPYKPTDRIKVFKEVPELGCFVVTDEFQRIADTIGLTEWHPTVWIGRLFVMDNDFGEHWLDNWEQREALSEKAVALGIIDEEQEHRLMIVNPKRMMDGKDGPCHSDEFRCRFWNEVLAGLHLSFGLICEEARKENEEMLRLEASMRASGAPEDMFIHDLDRRIETLEAPTPVR
jgi:hypothetical protein